MGHMTIKQASLYIWIKFAKTMTFHRCSNVTLAGLLLFGDRHVRPSASLRLSPPPGSSVGASPSPGIPIGSAGASPSHGFQAARREPRPPHGFQAARQEPRPPQGFLALPWHDMLQSGTRVNIPIQDRRGETDANTYLACTYSNSRDCTFRMPETPRNGR